MSELTLEERATNYETMRHIHEVQKLLLRAAHLLQSRCLSHDQSKLRAPEVDTFTKFTPLLKTVEYGSPEYKQFLADMAPALKNHYAHNSHHPEHYENGVAGMNLVDVVEMLVDWIASSQRTKDGNAYKSLKLQEERFQMSPQLVSILRNTIPLLAPHVEETVE
jgi:hypothetical protein